MNMLYFIKKHPRFFVHLGQNYFVRQSCVSCRISFNLIVIRSMKKVTQSVNNLIGIPPRNHELALLIQTTISNVCATPLRNKTDLTYVLAKQAMDTNFGENIASQTILKGLFPRWSMAKSDMLYAIKDNNFQNIAPNVECLFPKEKSDVRFFFEYSTASKFALTSPSIKKIVLNSEKPSTATVNISGSNKFSDVNIYFDNTIHPKDIKSGNNMSQGDNVLGEISYYPNGEHYQIMNKTSSLSDIQKTRMQTGVKNLQYLDLISEIEKLNILPLHDIQKNLLIQEEIFKYISAHPQFRTSFFVGTTVKRDLILNANFHKRLAPLLHDNIFNTKKDFQKFIVKAIQIYQEEINEIINNIQKSKDVWEGTGFESIANDIFTK